jgi:tetratricopeptide (TPR) repeat protein
VWPALALLALLALAVVFLLPQWLARPDTSAAGMSPAPGPQARQPAAARRENPALAARQAADRALEAYLRRAARLELARAPAWGEPEWTEAAASGAEADRRYELSRFDEAEAGYRRAEGMLRELEGQRGSRLETALSAGLGALEREDPQTAQAQFRVALSIEPAHPQAARGLERARVRPLVLDLMHGARQAETEGDLQSALDGYGKAVEMDQAYAPAREGRDRVAAAFAEAGFREAMSRALSALQEGRLGRAAEALQQAERLKPGDASAADLRMRLSDEQKQAHLSRLRRDAEARARAEDWEAAAALYQSVLQTEPNAGFARQGLEQARTRQQLHRQLDRYLEDPARLQSPAPRSNAEHLLANANPAPDQPVLRQKLARLERKVVEARTPVAVLLRSDGRTEVVVHHVGRLGRFRQRSLELRPGRYTAVGSRIGFRDVRREFEVRPGHAPAPVVVRCEEAL